MNDILWEERMMPLPSQCLPPLPTSSPEALPGEKDALTAGGGGIPETAGGSEGGGQGCGVETAVWKQKSPLKSLDIMSSCPGPLPSLSLPIVEKQ